MALSVISISPMYPYEVPALQRLIMNAVFDDFGFRYNAIWHHDVDHLATVYQGRNVMLAARAGGEIIGSAGLRIGAPVTIKGHYEKGDRDVAQIVRLVVRKDWRRHGLARQLIETLIPYAINDPETNHLYFHTSDTSASAMPFWASMGATMIRDDRPREPVTRTVHYQFDLAQLRADARCVPGLGNPIPTEDRQSEPLVMTAMW